VKEAARCPVRIGDRAAIDGHRDAQSETDVQIRRAAIGWRSWAMEGNAMLRDLLRNNGKGRLPIAHFRSKK
jgi:hypothetical protein